MKWSLVFLFFLFGFVFLGNRTVFGITCTTILTPNGSQTIQNAASASKPGDVICLSAGTYKITAPIYPKSGTANAYITYTSFNGEVRIENWGSSSAQDSNMFHFYHGINYVEVNDLTLDSRNVNGFPLKCDHSYHLRFIRNKVLNGGSGGIGSVYCDYLTADGNLVYHNGYLNGWSSGISYNSNQWSDTYSGIHNYIVNNIISGTVDQKGDPSTGKITDGNGIILDLSQGSYDPATANTPPVLVANNLVYQNGGRCIIAFVVTNAWIVNNTCYKNTLDLRLDPGVGEITFNSAKNSFAYNNIVIPWNNHDAYQMIGQSTNILFSSNIYFGSQNTLPSSISTDHTKVLSADPQLLLLPVVDQTADGQYAKAISPYTLTSNQFHMTEMSLARDKGEDPTVSGLSQVLITDLQQYLYSDLAGLPRKPGGTFDDGAFQYVSPNSPTPSPFSSISPPSHCPFKKNGDADCKSDATTNKYVTIIDFEIWRKEFFASCSQATISACGPDEDTDGQAMDANFNFAGSGNATTDTKVDLADFEIWRKGFFE